MADKPVTREEMYLAYLTGDYTGEIPKPITRKEKYLYELCLNGMGGEVSPEEIKSAVNEYLEKNPVKPGATTEQAQQIEQNKKDVASLKEDISTKITKFYASSQGETHLADSDNGKIMDMMLYGKSEQKQYSGTNLFDVQNAKALSGAFGLSVSISNNGIISIQGIIKGADSNVAFSILENREFFPLDAVFKAFELKESNCSVLKIRRTAANVSDKRIAIELSKLVNGTEISVSFRLMMSKSEITTYEPYTGGIPSPNPDYPQEIKSVVNPTVKVCGKNLFDIEKYLNDSHAIFSKDEESYNINMVQSLFLYPFTVAKEDTDISLSVNNFENITAANTKIELINKEGAIVARIYAGSSTKKVNGKACKVRFDWKNTGKILVSGIMLELGSTPTAYEPYHEQTVTLPYDLYGVKVTSGGNVTIDGQQHVSDYFDVERGKLVRMVDASKLDSTQSIVDKTEWLLAEPQETDLTEEEVQALKALATYYPTTNISINSEQLDGYTVFNYPISMKNGWNYVKQQLNDNRDYIYDMDARTQDTDLQAAEAYVNSEYAVALTELEV